MLFRSDDFGKNMAAKTPLLALPFHIPPSGIVMSKKEFAQETRLQNDGDRETGVVVTFVARGAVKNPRIDNLTTGEFLRIITDLNTGDSLSICTRRGEKRIELNGQNINQKIDRQSSFFQMIVGENVLKYSADDGYNNLDVYLRWTPEYLGV